MYSTFFLFCALSLSLFSPLSTTHCFIHCSRHYPLPITHHIFSRDHGGGLLDRSWGPGDGRPVADMKVALDQCLQEYLLSGDLPEAARCIRELNAKFFLHEVVKRAVSHAVDKSQAHQESMSSLLQYLHECDMLSVGQAVKGFRRLQQIIDDLALDTPTGTTHPLNRPHDTPF